MNNIYKVTVNVITKTTMIVGASCEEEAAKVVEKYKDIPHYILKKERKENFFSFEKIDYNENNFIPTEMGVIRAQSFIKEKDSNFFLKRKKLIEMVDRAMLEEGLKDYYLRWEYEFYDPEEGGFIDLKTFTEPYIKGGIKLFYSEEPYSPCINLKNPTIIDILVAIEKLIRLSEDTHHVFYEGIYKIDKNNYCVNLGS